MIKNINTLSLIVIIALSSCSSISVGNDISSDVREEKSAFVCGVVIEDPEWKSRGIREYQSLRLSISQLGRRDYKANEQPVLFSKGNSIMTIYFHSKEDCKLFKIDLRQKLPDIKIDSYLNRQQVSRSLGSVIPSGNPR